MDYELIKTGVLALSVLFSLGNAFVMMVDRRERVTQKALAKQEAETNKRLSELSLRVQDIEQEIKHFAKAEQILEMEKRFDVDITRLHVRIDDLINKIGDLSKSIGELAGAVKAVNNQVDMMNEFLINRRRADD